MGICGIKDTKVGTLYQLNFTIARSLWDVYLKDGDMSHLWANDPTPTYLLRLCYQCSGGTFRVSCHKYVVDCSCPIGCTFKGH